MPDDGRQYWLWVARPQFYLEDDGTDRESLDPENNYDTGGWWTCNKATKEGDLVLLYRAKLKKDIGYLILAESDAYSIADDNDEGWDYGCDYQVLYKFTNPVHIKDLRKDPFYDDWGALRGNFQGSSFRISDKYWASLNQLAATKNPVYQSFLDQILKEPIAEYAGRGEKALEEALVNNLEILRKFGYDLELYFDPESKLSGRQYVCKGNGGRIDLLCCDRTQNRYVVIELKNVRAGLNTFGQISNYMGWVQERMAKNNLVDGLVISRGFDTKFESALKITERIKQKNVEDLGLAIDPPRILGRPDYPKGPDSSKGISKSFTKKQQIRAFMRKGNNLSKLGNYGEAIKAYDEAIKLDPTRTIAWNKKGLALYKLGKYSDAIQAYNEAIKVDPKDSDGWYNKGLALLELREFGEAIQAYDEAIRVDPKDAFSWCDKSVALGYLDKYDEAIQCINEAIKLDPKITIAWENKGYFLIDMGIYEEAIQAFDEAIRLDPKGVNAWNGKSVALLELGKYDTALQCINDAIRLDQKIVDAWYNKGCALLELSKYGESIQAFDEAIKLDPKDAKAWYNKGEAFYELAKYDDALQAYDEAIKLDPKDAESWHKKGKSLEALGRSAEADEAYNKARELGWISPVT